jgi:hypothetical protein
MGITKKTWMAVSGATLFGVTLLPAAGGQRDRLTPDAAARALVYGQTDADWTARAAALVAHDADAAALIGRVAESNRVDPLARSRALEALALAGTRDADEALRHALASPTVRNDATFPMLVATVDSVYAQRLATLECKHAVHQARSAAPHKR